MARQMKDSGIEWIGEIPEAWRVSKMKYIGDYVNGYHPPSQGTKHTTNRGTLELHRTISYPDGRNGE